MLLLSAPGVNVMTPLVGGASEGQVITSVKKEWVDELSVSDNKDRGFIQCFAR